MKKQILVFVLCALTFLGCEKKDIGETADGEGTGKVVTMQLWTTVSPQFFQSLTREFVAEMAVPNLRFNIISFANKKELETFLLDQLAEGAGPDIVYIDGEWIQQNPGKIEPASDTEDGFNESNFRNTFAEAANELFIRDGQIYGVPLGVDTLALIYNDEHIKDRLPDSNFPGRTWEALKIDITSLTKTDNSFERFNVSGGALGRFDNVTYGGDILENIMLQMGVQFFDPSGTQALFDKTESQSTGSKKINLGVEAVNFFTSFADNRFKNYSWNEPIASSASGSAKDFEAFARGKTSIVFGYSADIAKISDSLEVLRGSRQSIINDKNIRIIELPQMEDPSLGLHKRVLGKVSGLAVSRASRYPDTAWKFLKFAVQKENLRSWHEETLQPSPRVDMLREQMEEPRVDAFARQVKFARANVLPLPRTQFYEAMAPYILAINERRAAIDKSLGSLAKYLSQKLRDKKQKEKEIVK